MLKRFLHIIIVIFILTLIQDQIKAQQPSLYEIERMSFNSNLFSDISPVIVKDGIIFCSDRRLCGLQDRTSFDGSRLYNIYFAGKKDSSDYLTPKELKSERSMKFNNGPLCVGPDGQTVYFTSEVETGSASRRKNFPNHNGIFIADKAGSDLVSIRAFKYNGSDYEVAHPSVSSDGKFLFFASDMPGGQGGSDLYYCKLVNGEWGEPVNLGSGINTAGKELYPYMHPSGRLYFSSTRSGGAGKLDIYFTSITSGVWDDPVRLPEPINSASDDFAFVAQDNLQTGYFTSNRTKDDDIYEFKSLIIRKTSCDTLQINSYCYRFVEENAIKLDTVPFRYEWRFGDGNKASGIVVEHCYDSPGTYLVQLDVVNLITKEVLHNQKSDTLIVTAIEQPYISAPDILEPGQSVTLSADSTNLPGWRIAQYYWNFGDESISIGKEAPKTYSKAGTYNIQLIVTTEPEADGSVKEACISKNIIVIRKP